MSAENSLQNTTDLALAAYCQDIKKISTVLAKALTKDVERDEYINYASQLCLGTDKTVDPSQRLSTLFEKISPTGFEKTSSTDKKETTSPKFVYAEKPLSPSSIFPIEDPKTELDHAEIATQLKEAFEKIPTTHHIQNNLLLDHLDTLWQTYAHGIACTADVSLYDHSKITAAYAVALYQFRPVEFAENALQTTDKPFLLIQGDFFGIQDFIFASGAQTNKAAAKLLRGRSFYVSLLSELAALKILKALNLPSTSQVMNAAGKFLIIAGNTEKNITAIKEVQKELNTWFLTHSFGMAGIGIAYTKVSCDDLKSENLKNTQKALFAKLERKKLQRFDLCGTTEASTEALTKTPPIIFDTDYSNGICAYNGKIPADNNQDCALSRDQIKIGQCLAKLERTRIVIAKKGIFNTQKTNILELSIFDYQVAFTDEGRNETEMFRVLAEDNNLLRIWDISLPESMDEILWHGYARRNINAYVPVFESQEKYNSKRYKGEDREEFNAYAPLKTLGDIACEDRILKEDSDKYIGQTALTTLKGDVDNLGAIFQQGLKKPSFTKMIALSRQMNNFFAVYLPALCKTEYPNTYTVFAGGDDFFLIGPWHSTQKLAKRMADKFKEYVANNSEIHFSAGMVITKPNVPIYYLAHEAEEALEKAKAYNPENLEDKPKNAFSVYGICGTWETCGAICEAYKILDQENLSTGYIYSLLSFCDHAENKNAPLSQLWKSQFTYRTIRMLNDTNSQKNYEEIFVKGIYNNIQTLGKQYRIALTNYIYKYRE